MSGENKDVRLEISAKNNILWQAIKKDWRSVSAFCQQHKFNPTIVGRLLSLKDSPFDKNGQYRMICRRIAEKLMMMVEDLFPLNLYAIKFPEAVIEVPFSALQQGRYAQSVLSDTPFTIRSPEEVVASHNFQEVVDKALSILTPRERVVLELRFGFNGKELGPYAIGRLFRLSRERVRQIEAEAMRKLRNRRNAALLIEYVD